MSSYNRERNESTMHRLLSDIIMNKLNDRSLGFTTVTQVKITRDYSYATVYVSFIGDGDVNAKLEILEKAKGLMRHELSQRMKIRRIPELVIKYDDTYEKARRLDEIFKKINED
ncbi:MAG TPA: 30S ribosome-binding factor RbfA [Bacilli bacterium]|nr:30S ribosome-binding factor RbfA [Bacilli bacterium]